MRKALSLFSRSLSQTRTMSAFYIHAVNTLNVPHEQVSDILRFQHVYAVSTLDRLIHELVSVGCLEIFLGKRIPTEKFSSLSFKSDILMHIKKDIYDACTPESIITTASSMIDRELRGSLKFVSFQAVDKINDWLGVIWEEKQKFYKLAEEMGISGNDANERAKNLKQKLTVTVGRRHNIAHEADIDPVTEQKREITKAEVDSAIDFISAFGNAIGKFVTDASCYTNTQV